MKLFTAIETLGDEGDFAFTVPGELVHFAPVICADRLCGCDRSMGGFVSHKATTCFVARDLDMDVATYTDLLFASLEAGGWVTDSDADDHEWVQKWAAEHIELAAQFPVEHPLRIRRDHVVLRSEP